MNTQILFQDIENMEYRLAWNYQEELFNRILQLKKQNQSSKNEEQEITPNYLLFVEHPPVFTLGKSGDQNNLLINHLELNKIKADYVKTNRGGDITFHGPGQLVAYPIFDLDNFKLGLKDYIEKLEEVVIRTLKEYGIESARLPAATGVWLDVGIPGKERKICAIGVRTSKFVSMHGFAFNINTDLNYFNHINPCGFINKGVTSLQKELSRPVDLDEVKFHVLRFFQAEFNSTIIK